MRKRKSKLARWLYDAGRTVTETAAELGCSKQHLSNIVHGHSSPSLELAVAIDKLTSGAVPVESWQ